MDASDSDCSSDWLSDSDDESIISEDFQCFLESLLRIGHSQESEMTQSGLVEEIHPLDLKRVIIEAFEIDDLNQI